VRSKPLFREPQFRLLFLGRTLAFLGNAVAPVALAFAVLDLTGSKSDLGLLLAARSLPQVVFILVGGALSDRLPRNHVMVASSVVSGLSQASIAFLLLNPSRTALAPDRALCRERRLDRVLLSCIVRRHTADGAA